MNEKQGPRARDADRQAVVQELQDAFIDGQIDAGEHETRTALALAATHLVDLEPLLADLQVTREPYADNAPVLPEKTLAQRVGRFLRTRWHTVLIGVVVVLAVLFGARQMLGGTDDVIGVPDSPAIGDPGPDGEPGPQQTVQWSEVRADLPRQSASTNPTTVPTVGRWSPTEEKIRALFEHYRGALGTPYFSSLWINADHAYFERPISGTLARTERWDYRDSSFTPSEPQDKGRDTTLIDLRDLDLDTFFDNVEYALAELEAPETQLMYISISVWQGEPQVAIYVEDPLDAGTVGYLNTTMAGTITSEYLD